MKRGLNKIEIAGMHLVRSSVYFLLLCGFASSAYGQAIEEEVVEEPASDLDYSGMRLSDSAELDRVVALYTSGEYERCEQELQAFLSTEAPSEKLIPFVDPQVIERGRLYLATCSLLMGNEETAHQALRAALEENPLMSPPDSLTFPPPLIRLFSEVRKEVELLIAAKEEEELRRLREERREDLEREAALRQREAELLRLAAEEVVIRQNSRALAFVPFGVGQYQNGNRGWGHFFLASELIAAGTTLGGWLAVESLNRTYEKYASPQSGRQLDVDDFNRKKSLAMTTLKAASWTWLGLSVVGIIDAQLRFQPETRLGTRKRELPSSLAPADASQTAPTSDAAGVRDAQARASSLQLLPVISVMPEGGYLGVFGSF